MIKVKRNRVIFIIIFTLIICTSFTSFADSGPLNTKTNMIVSNWIAKGILNGDSDGNLKLTEPITRAEFAVIICRVFNFNSPKYVINISDVPRMKWYASSVYKLISKEIMSLQSFKKATMFYPDSTVTFREAFDSLQKAYQLSSSDSLYTTFLEPQSLNLDVALTKLDCIMFIDKLTQCLINKPGTYTSSVNGNLVINTSNVVLKNLTVEGNLYLTEGIGTGSVTLKNVCIKGTVYVNGCGTNSLLLKKHCSIDNMIVDNKISTVRLYTSEKDTVKNLVLLTPTILDGPECLLDAQSVRYAIYDSNTPHSYGIDESAIRSSSDPLSSASESVPNANIPNISSPPEEAPASNLPSSNQPVNPGQNMPPSSNDTSPEDTPSTSVPIPNNSGVTTDSTISLDHPSNLFADFEEYPSVKIGWDNISNADSYHLTISCLQNSNDIYSVFTTCPMITLKQSAFFISPENEYRIIITARSSVRTSESTAVLKLPCFQLHELENGTLQVESDGGHLTNIDIKNFNLEVCRQIYNSDSLVTSPVIYRFSSNGSPAHYPIPITLENDTTYILKVADTSPLSIDVPLLSSYTASFFANVSFSQAAQPDSKVTFNESNPIELSTARHLNNLSLFVSKGAPTKGKYFTLTKNIDFLGFSPNMEECIGNFTPIGICADDPNLPNLPKKILSSIKPFEGDFDGQNHVISHLKITIDCSNITQYPYKAVGLFALTTGSVKNITLDNTCNIAVHDLKAFTAGIIGYADFKDASKVIVNCHNYAQIDGYYASGIVGKLYCHTINSRHLINCSNYGQITSDYTASGIISTLVIPDSKSIIVSHCSNYNTIQGKSYAAGIIGESRGAGMLHISYCNNLNDIVAKSKNKLASTLGAGGIVGYGNHAIDMQYCFNSGKITSEFELLPSNPLITDPSCINAGGIIGYLSSFGNTHLMYCYNCAPTSSSLYGKGTKYSGPITAQTTEPSHFAYCYALSRIYPPSSGSQDSTMYLSDIEFINRITQDLPHLTDTVRSLLS